MPNGRIVVLQVRSGVLKGFKILYKLKENDNEKMTGDNTTVTTLRPQAQAFITDTSLFQTKGGPRP